MLNRLDAGDGGQRIKTFRMFVGDVRRVTLDKNATCGIRGTSVASITWETEFTVVLSGETLTGNVGSVLLAPERAGFQYVTATTVYANGEATVDTWRLEVIPPDFIPPPVAPDCPTLLVPIDGSDVGEVTETTLLWVALPDVESYQIYFWADGDVQPATPTVTVTETSYQLTGLTLGATYHLLINAVGTNGLVSDGCTEATFSTNAADAIIEWQSATFTGDILGEEVTLVAVRSGNTTTTASADYDFTEGTALIGPDFVATPGTVTFSPGEVVQNVVVPLVRDYNAEVLADNPTAFWPFTEASGLAFEDLTANNLDLAMSSATGFSYQQPDLNLSADGSVSKTGTNSWRLSVNVNSFYPAHTPIPFTVRGWVKHFSQSGNLIKSLFQVGGAGGSGQFYFCWCYRAATTGLLTMVWHHKILPSGPNVVITKTFTQVIPLDEVYWFEAGYDTDNNRCFFKFKDQAVEYVSYNSVTETPNGLDNTAGRQTLFYVGQRPVGNSGDMIDGYFSDYEMVPNAVQLIEDRWPRWNLDASLNFLATLSNPSVDTQIGTIDETTMTIEAP